MGVFSLWTPSRTEPLCGDSEFRARGRGLTREALGKRQCAFPRVPLCIVAVYISIAPHLLRKWNSIIVLSDRGPLRRIIRKWCPSFVYKPVGMSEMARVFQLATARATSCSGFLFLNVSSFQQDSWPPNFLFYFKKSGICTLSFFFL